MIVADSDEYRSSKVIQHLKKQKIELTHEDMQNPDYLVANVVGVERATMNDFVGKIKKRNVEAQLERVVEKGYIPALLVEGIVPTYTKMSLEAIYGKISSVSEAGVLVEHTISAKHTARRLVELHEKVCKDELNHLKVPVVLTKSDHPTLKKLMGIEGIDETMAKRIMDEYPGMLSFVRDCHKHMKGADSRLLNIQGVGKTKADSIAKDMTTRWRKDD